MSTAAGKRSIEVLHLPGQVAYREALSHQLARRNAVEAGTASNALYTLEHTPVVTCGRHTNPAHLLHPPEAYAQAGIELIETDRGGDVTYHGPGQLTAYPILDLAHWTQSVHWYLRQLEEVIILTLADFGIDANRLEGFTGVWTDQGKVAQIGIGIHRWVTFHGVAINVEPNMSHFAMIVPCGIPDHSVTSMRATMGDTVKLEDVRHAFARTFLKHFATL